MNRRNFIQSTLRTALGIGAAGSFSNLTWARDQGPAIKLGAQTNAWTIDPKNLDSFLSVLAQIKRVGYAGFETGFFNLVNYFDAPEEARKHIASSGLDFIGIHIALPPAKNDPTTYLPPPALYERVALGGKSLGARRLFFSGAPAPTEADVTRKVEALNTAGKFARDTGLIFAYHNHWFEFESKVNEIERLYNETDPSTVSFVLDAGHAYRGGANLPEFLNKHSKRIVALHLRDYKNGKQIPLGEGTVPLTEIASSLRNLNWSGWAINEEEREDGTKAGIGFIEPAYKALRRAFAS